MLRVHSNEIGIVNNSFRCIHHLIDTPSASNKSVLRNSDIAEVAVKVLTKYSQVKGKKYNSDICASGTIAISSISKIANSKLGALGCCELLVELLKTCTNEEVASGCIQAIANMTASEQNNQKKLAAVDTCESIVKAIGIYPNSSTVAEHSCTAMLSLISTSPNKMKLKRAGAESIAKNGMDNPEFTENLRKNYENLLNKL
jgi:hypothetical protein